MIKRTEMLSKVATTNERLRLYLNVCAPTRERTIIRMLSNGMIARLYSLLCKQYSACLEACQPNQVCRQYSSFIFVFKNFIEVSQEIIRIYICIKVQLTIFFCYFILFGEFVGRFYISLLSCIQKHFLTHFKL